MCVYHFVLNDKAKFQLNESTHVDCLGVNHIVLNDKQNFC